MTALSVISEWIYHQQKKVIIITSIIKALRMKAAINRFSTSDFQRFERFVNMLVKENNKKLTSTFTKLVSNRQLLTSQGIANYQTRINIYVH